MATKKDKIADYKYQIVTPEEMREVKWLIEQGDYKDMNDYIERETRIQKRIMRREDAEKKKRTPTRRKKLVSKERKKAA